MGLQSSIIITFKKSYEDCFYLAQFIKLEACHEKQKTKLYETNHK